VATWKVLSEDSSKRIMSDFRKKKGTFSGRKKVTCKAFRRKKALKVVVEGGGEVAGGGEITNDMQRKPRKGTISIQGSLKKRKEPKEKRTTKCEPGNKRKPRGGAFYPTSQETINIRGVRKTNC